MNQNVIRYQIRAGGNIETQARGASLPANAHLTRMDVTFESYRFRGAETFSIETVYLTLKNDPELRDCGLFISKSHSWSMPDDSQS
jgi:hypothetical protein